MGKTRRPVTVRISEHIAAAKAGFFKTIIGRHVALEHGYVFNGFKFLPLTRIDRHDRGDWDRALLQAESKWIFRLQSHTFPGLNDSLLLCFYNSSFLSNVFM